jgi:hypothetical protein
VFANPNFRLKIGRHITMLPSSILVPLSLQFPGQHLPYVHYKHRLFPRIDTPQTWTESRFAVSKQLGTLLCASLQLTRFHYEIAMRLFCCLKVQPDNVDDFGPKPITPSPAVSGRPDFSDAFAPDAATYTLLFFPHGIQFASIAAQWNRLLSA